MASLNLPRLVVVAVHSSAVLAAAAATAGNSSVLPPPSPPDNSSSSTDNSSVPASFRPSIAVIVGVLTTMFSLTFLLLIYAKHCKRSPVGVFGPDDLPMMPQQLVFRTDCGIDPAVVEALPTFSFSSLKGNKEGLECAVCLSKYEDQELLRLLPKCKHAFHVDCVDTWLASHSTCPLCRHCVSSEDVFIVDEMMLMLSSRRRSMDHPIPAPLLVEPPLHGGGSRRSSLDIEMGGEFQIYVHREFEENGNPQQDRSASRDENSLVEAEKQQQQGIDQGIDQATSTGSTRRLGHRIIVSDVMLQRRWSDLVPSDVLFLGSSHTLFWPSDRVHTTGIGLSRSSSSSRSRCDKLPAAHPMKRAFSLGRYDAGHGRFMGGTSTTQRSMSEITGLERFSSNSRKMVLGMNQNDSGGGFQDAHEEATRRWSSIAKRTLNWLMRREKKPPLASALGNL